MKPSLFIIMAICVVIAFGYALVMDKIKKTSFNATKYIALAVVAVIAVIATILSKLQAYVGGPVIAMILAMIVCNIMPDISKDFKAGTTFAAKKYLSLGVILTGATLNFAGIVASVRALPLIIFNICLSFAVAYLVGRKVLKVSGNTCTLVGGGTCICGGTAIASLGSIVKADEEEIGYAMAAIFLFDVFACILYPYLAGWLGLSNAQFAFLSGTAINDTSSVVASNATYSSLNGIEFNDGTTVKLVRTTMLIVLALIFTVLEIRKATKSSGSAGGANLSVGKNIMKIFPWFILGFLAMALLNTFGVFSAIPYASEFFKTGSKFFITMALAGVGFKMKFKDVFAKGIKPIALGGCTWLAVAASSLSFIYIFANYVNNTAF